MIYRQWIHMIQGKLKVVATMISLGIHHSQYWLGVGIQTKYWVSAQVPNLKGSLKMLRY